MMKVPTSLNSVEILRKKNLSQETCVLGFRNSHRADCYADNPNRMKVFDKSRIS